MLVANPGQAPYTIISKKPCSNKSARNNARVSSANRYMPPSSATIAPSSSTVISKTMTAVTAIPTNNEPNNLKTLSVRITREADLFKNTVQKTLPSKIPSHHISVLSLYTVPPTSIHRYPERIEANSVDSLKSEMCHFKPIRTVPTTPAKRSKAITIKIPEPKLAVKKESLYNKDESPKPSINLTDNIDYSWPRVSAFSLVALSSSNVKQEHKITNTSSLDYRKKGESSLISGKLCEVPMCGNNIIPSSVDCSANEQLIPPTSVKHRTRRNTKTVTSTFVFEQQNNKTKTEKETRVTRKRQPQSDGNETAPIKNVKLSKDCSKPIKNGKKRNASTGRLQPNRRTPPVTRSRLKQSLTHTRKQYQNK